MKEHALDVGSIDLIIDAYARQLFWSLWTRVPSIWVVKVTQALLALDPTPTAVIVLNAWMGRGIIRAIHERGLRIPTDISLVGILSPQVAEMIVPPLTAIDFPYKTMGYTGADLLLRQLEGETLSVQKLLQPPLTIRQSAGPCPS